MCWRSSLSPSQVVHYQHMRFSNCRRWVNQLKTTPEAFGRFDRILLDVPCSNTGVIRRKPDVRCRFSKAGLTCLGATQRELLECVAGLVKRGGSIVYSTCSLEPEENDRLIWDWLKTHPEFRLQSSRQSFPPTSGQDGAYAVLLAVR